LAGGLAALRSSDYRTAEAELAKVQGADRPAALVAHARVALTTGRYADANARAKQAETTPAMRAAAVAVRAEALLSIGKAADAIRALETVQKEPGTPGLAAKLLLGDALIAVGRRSDAERPLMEVVQAYNDDAIPSTDAEALTLVGRAAHLLRSPKDANRAYGEAEQADKKNVDLLLARADLFLDKYDPGHAEELTEEALAIAPSRPDALAMMARVKLEQTLDFSAAEALVAKALAVNPSHAGALAVRAGLALRDLDIPKADTAIDAGLAAHPEDLELLSLKATARFLADDRPGYDAAKKRVLGLNREYSQFFGIAAEYAEWEHRYDDIVTMMREATKIDPEDAKAWAQLGVMEMRSGDEAAGLEALKKAWSLDHFNVRVFNTLNLYEKSIATSYETLPAGVFRIRYPKDERAVLERYVPKLLGEAWASMKARYGFAPKTPVQIELYDSREHFAVRTSGLPNVGIQGVCFGRVLASMTPQGEPFNWGNVLWHELGHVFAIELSKSHVPRWFTEGLSEYETIARRPEWHREQDPDLALALRKGTLPRAVDMNRAFTHAKNGADVTVAYYASSQLLVYTVDTFGMARVVNALRAWGDGLRTEDVLQRAFGVSASQYDDGFRAWLKTRLARYDGQFIFDDRPEPLDEAKARVEKEKSADAHAAYALSLLHAKKGEEARAELAAALAADPKNMTAHFLAAKLEKDPAARESHLHAIQAAGGDGFAVRMELAGAAEMRKDRARMAAELESAHRFDPSQSEPLRGLLELAHAAKRPDDELAVLRKLAPLEQHDAGLWRMYMARLVEAKAWDEAKRAGESAVFVDLEGAETHLAYGRALGATGDHERAAFELETALLTEPPAPVAAATHQALAVEYRALGKPAEATRHEQEAQRAAAAPQKAQKP
jgi:tetratricopeptide (TPR) repeat protein